MVPDPSYNNLFSDEDDGLEEHLGDRKSKKNKQGGRMSHLEKIYGQRLNTMDSDVKLTEHGGTRPTMMQ